MQTHTVLVLVHRVTSTVERDESNEPFPFSRIATEGRQREGKKGVINSLFVSGRDAVIDIQRVVYLSIVFHRFAALFLKTFSLEKRECLTAAALTHFAGVS